MTETTPFHPDQTTARYADVLLPLALEGTFTYRVPEVLIEHLTFGQRVEVPFGKRKSYAGIVVRVHSEQPEHRVKSVLALLDDRPIIEEVVLRFWNWLADYYCCTPGEVMEAAVPAHLKLASERRLVISPFFDENYSGLSDAEFLLMEALSIQEEISISDARAILSEHKSIYPVIMRLMEKKLILLKEELKEKYKPKRVNCVRLQEPYRSYPHLLGDAFTMVERSDHQTRALLAFVQLSKEHEHVRESQINATAGTTKPVLRAIAKKDIFEFYSLEVSRFGKYTDETEDKHALTETQTTALAAIRQEWAEKNVVLLHGVTGSGKTRLYIELMQEALERGEQVLYLLPEIGLTTQIIQRLRRIFGDRVSYYHHRLNNHERVEVWQTAASEPAIFVGARSAIFLPVTNLGLVIVDEEHDPSFKQQDPAPRYHGRDAAVYLAHLHGAKTLLGTATPAIETYHNARTGKFGLVEMTERYGGIAMPEILLADLRAATRAKEMHGRFSKTLVDDIKAALDRDEQVILFQNRRGYAPRILCTACGWHQECTYCDVGMTYHKFKEKLQCHYCGSLRDVPTRCPACSSEEVKLHGFGTEQLEEAIGILLPDARVGRMDFDTVRGKYAHARLIQDFEDGQLDILVGTQMVSKGLDFENVALVGILSADQLLSFPDFRSSERGYQLMTQVAGRAGRRKKQGRVILQAFNVEHPVLEEVLRNDYTAFFQREILERQEFNYPPFVRMVKITLKHAKPNVVNTGAKVFGHYLKKHLGERVQGPAIPMVGKIRNQYLLDFIIKLDKNIHQLKHLRRLIRDARSDMKAAGYGGVRVNVDVDPV